MSKPLKLTKWLVLTGLTWGMALTVAWGAEQPVKKKKQTAKVDPSKVARRQAAIKARTAENAQLEVAAIPKDVTTIAPRKTKGQSYLPIANTKILGRPIESEQLDALLAIELEKEGAARLPVISEDQLVRRLFLDLIGQLPAPADIEEYLAQTDADKKAKLIDKLLAMPRYGRNWGRYWRDVVWYRSTLGTDNRASLFDEEEWLTKQFNDNVPWDKIVTSIITARGASDDTPQGFMYGAHMGNIEDLTGEVSRIFLGVQIACAQCHDHPTDTWKRDQFHELASFMGQTTVRRRRDLTSQPGKPRLIVEVTQAPAKKQYKKPDAKDASKPGEFVAPVFLTGQGLPMGANDAQRREALATFLTSKRNANFSKAMVNRMWAELTGRGFVNPVDDLSPARDVVAPKVFDALAKSFAASDYDVKQLVRVITNTRYYERSLAGTTSAGAGPLAKGLAPSRLSSDQILDALDWVFGQVDDNVQGAYRRPSGARSTFRQIFGYDPSTDQKDLEGSITQALALMNHPVLANRLQSQRPGTLLAKVLASKNSDRDVVEMIYLRALARKPTDAESRRCLEYVRETGNRAEAFEDILWALVNSTEFLHNN